MDPIEAEDVAAIVTDSTFMGMKVYIHMYSYRLHEYVDVPVTLVTTRHLDNGEVVISLETGDIL